jgi:hypothetical protein
VALTLKQAKLLCPGDILVDDRNRRWKVNGQVQVWKKEPGRVRVPLKHGLYSYDEISQNRLHLVTPERAPAAPQFKSGQRVRQMDGGRCATVLSASCRKVNVRFDADPGEYGYYEDAFKRDSSCGRAPKLMPAQKAILGGRSAHRSPSARAQKRCASASGRKPSCR